MRPTLTCTEHPLELGSVHPYCLPRALSRLLLMVSRKSVVFRKCSFSFTLPRKHGVGVTQASWRPSTKPFPGTADFRHQNGLMPPGTGPILLAAHC